MNLKEIKLDVDWRDKKEIYGDISSLRSLMNLERINLDGTEVTGDISSLSDLKNLGCIRVKGTKVTGELTLPNGSVITAGN